MCATALCLPTYPRSAPVVLYRGVLENKERWMELCALAAEEQDPETLMKLIAEITALLEAKERRLKGNASIVPVPPPESA
jgi:hypothetical protein